MKRYNHNSHDAIKIEDKKVDKFLDEIIEVCKKHNMSISHEDFQGSFLIENFDKDNINWLYNAAINYSINNRDKE